MEELRETVTLDQILERMVASERLLILDEVGRELFKGFVGSFKYSKVDSMQEVKEVSIVTRTFRREKIKMIPEKERVEIQEDELADYSFYDVEFFIYQKITLKGT